MASFFDEIGSVVAQLPNADAFREVGRREDPQSFGNACITYEASELKLRFVKDRGEIRTEIATPGQPSWWTLDQLCEVLGKRPPGLDLQSNGESLMNNFRGILDSLTPPALSKTKEMLEGAAYKKREEMLARFRRS